MNKPWLAGLVMAVILGGAADAQAPISGKLRQAASVADASQREPRLIQLLGSIDPSAPMDAATRAELELLADYRSELMRPANPEHRVHLEQPAFPIAARARALRAAALEADAARAWLARWRRDSVLPAADLRQPGRNCGRGGRPAARSLGASPERSHLFARAGAPAPPARLTTPSPTHAFD